MNLASQLLIVVVALLYSVTLTNGQDKGADVKKAIALVRKHIDAMPQGKDAGEVLPQTAAAVKSAFPDYQMVLVRFRIFPIARVMPEGLKPSNIFAVSKDGKITYLKDTKTLEKFFHAHAIPAKQAQDAKTILSAWLTLTPEFHQDGFFKFEVLEKEFAIEGDKAAGRVVVMQGGNGDLRAELVLDKEGKLAKATEKAAIRPGPRPICQATKLLDADPVVRRIAEQDLLIMGLSARGYIMEQRALATPELRQAIDRVWRQIEKNGW
jgi:hypothetical protein